MEVTMTRGQIRQAMEAICGMQSGGVNTQAKAQLNAFIDTAYLDCLAQMTWMGIRRVAYTTLAIDQETLPLPSDCTPGGVVSMAYENPDDHKYVEIMPRDLRPEDDYEALDIVGGDEDEAVRDAPTYYSEREGGIRIWPPADVAYRIRIEYNLLQLLPSDATVCPIDGEVVKRGALALQFALERNDAMAALWLKRMNDRIGDLRSAQCVGETIQYGDELHDDPEIIWIPNWDFER